MTNIYFTSDLHLGHNKILLPTYSNRPYKTIEEHDNALISNWNQVVGPNDRIYFLGDLALCHPEKALQMVSKLNGQKYWIKGNHDNERLIRYCSQLFIWVKDIAEIEIPDSTGHRGIQPIVLSHYAMRVWNRSHYGAWQLYGHSHGHLPDDPTSLSMDVGVDCHNYYPISYEEIKQIMIKKQKKQIASINSDE